MRLLCLCLLAAGCGSDTASYDPVVVNDAAGALKSDIKKWTFAQYTPAADSDVVFGAQALTAASTVAHGLDHAVTLLSATMLGVGGQNGAALRIPTTVTTSEVTWDNGMYHLGIGVAKPRLWHVDQGGAMVVSGTLADTGDSFAIDAAGSDGAGELQVVTGSDGDLPYLAVDQVQNGATLHHRSSSFLDGGVVRLMTTYEVADGAGVIHGVVRWKPDQSARADVTLAAGGKAVECWNASWKRVYYLDGKGGAAVGDVAKCPFGAP